MAYSPSSLFTVASELLPQATLDGGHLRTVISRAYYGALIVARDARSLSTIGEGGHNHVINAYKGNAADQVVADALSSLKKLRVKADYHPLDMLSSNDAKVAVALCKKVLKRLDALPPQEQLAQLH